MSIHDVARKYLAELYDKRDLVGVDTPPPTEKFVLKQGHKFFYGTKNNKPVWTYDVRLALSITRHEASAFAAWLGLKEDAVHPAPAEGRQA